MRLGTTETLTLNLPESALADAAEAALIMEQGERTIMIPGSELTIDKATGTVTKVIDESVTQNFIPGWVYLQLRWKNEDGTKEETDIKRIRMKKTLGGRIAWT